MMTNVFQHRPLRPCVCICALGLALGAFGAALASEQHQPEPDAEPTRLQDFASRKVELAIQAMGMIGIPYRYGGNEPENGLDCSGLVRYVFKQTWGAELPRTSEEISQLGEHVDAHELQPGDLVFYNTLRRAFSHVGIYLGNNKFVHASSKGGRVRIADMDAGYWKKRFNGARRINPLTGIDSNATWKRD